MKGEKEGDAEGQRMATLQVFRNMHSSSAFAPSLFLLRYQQPFHL